MAENNNKNIKMKYFFIGILSTIIFLGLMFIFYRFIINPKPIDKNIDSKNEVKDIKEPEENKDEIPNISMKRIDVYSKKQLEKYFGFEFKPNNINSIYEGLSKIDTWKNLKYSEKDSNYISNRFKESTNQAYGILKDIIHYDKSLKLILIPNNSGLQVNIGTDNYVGEEKLSLTEEDTNNIKELDIDIEYGKKEVEIEYEIENNIIKSKYKNEITGELLENEHSKTFLKNTILNIDYSNNQEKVIKEVLKNLNLDQNFSKFDIEVEFFNNNKIEFSIRQ